MTKKEEIEDSLQFCNDLNFYAKSNIKDPSSAEPADNQISSSLNEYIDWFNVTNRAISGDNNICPYPKEYSSRTITYEFSLEVTEDITSKRSLVRELCGFAICILLAFVIAYFVTNYVGQQTRVDGPSMEDTLHNNDYLLIDKISYRFQAPKRFDIIVFPYEDNVYYIKRIIGLPGERVLIKNNKVYINGCVLNENFGKEEISDPGNAADEILLGDGEYFVLGDNRNNSKDSRRAEVGLISRDKIVGKAFFRIFPFDKIGLLKHK